MGVEHRPLTRAPRGKTFRRLAVALLAGAALSAAAATFAAERHYPYDGLDGPVDDEGNCYNCHTLDKAEGVADTSHIQISARTMGAILSKNGGAAPEHLGCTFCHFSITSTTMMKEVFGHFGNKPSKHPVGTRYDNGADTDGEYFSTIDLNPANDGYELDCVDCHDPGLLAPDLPIYVGHVDKTLAQRSDNLKMLRGGVSAVGAYDDLCRLCHGTGMMAPVASHADGANLNPIVEDDGTRLQTTPATNPQNDKTQCTKCHDAHYSGKVRLFKATIDGNNCTALCHFAGDEDDNYDKHGHNKGQSTYKYKLGVVNFTTGSTIGLGMPCTSCHAALDTGNPATREAHARGPVGADNQTKYRTRFNLDKQPVPADDSGSVYGNPLRGTCVFCHQTYEEHVVNAAGTSDVGCLDCHDEHAEGSGTGSNAFMIPETAKANGVYNQSIPGYRVKAGVETVGFVTPRYQADGTSNSGSIDFFKGALTTGACDIAECHGKWGASLGDLMSSGGSFSHTGPSQLGGADCEGCHKHSGDSGGGWRAKDACDTCHANNGLRHADSNESATTHNTRHKAGAYITNCDDCHPHHGDVAVGTEPHGTGTVDFKTKASGGKLDATLSYANGAFANTDCNSLNGCHDSDANEWRAGSLGADACEDCHDAATKGTREVALKSMDQGWWVASSPGSASARHLKHINASESYLPTDCDDCHGASASLGTHGLHRNGTVIDTVVNYLSGDQSCTNACHATAAGDWTAGGTLACSDCHSGTNSAGGGPNLPASGLHATTETAMISQNQHDDSWQATRGGAVGSATCVTCHTSSPSTQHVNGTLSSSSVTFAALVGYSATPSPSCGPSGALSTCHGDVGAWKRRWSATADDQSGDECDNCHGTFRTAADSWVNGISARHNGTADPGGEIEANHASGLGECYQCHGFATASSYYSPTVNWGYHRDGSVQLNDQNTFLDPGSSGEVQCNGCHAAPYGIADGQHSFLDTQSGDGLGADRWGRAMIPGPAVNCSGCHGTNGSNTYPDSGAQNGSGYENRGGAHQKHVAAIVSRNAGTSAVDGSTCIWCHPGGSHSGDHTSPPADVMDGVANSFRTISGGSDANGAFVPASSTCTNVDCHAGTTTPGWYSTPDTAAPTWAANSGIAATNPSQGGVLNVTWNAAADAYPSNPVTYDLYKSTTNSAAAVFAGPPIATDLVGTSATVAGLSDGTTYYFGVRAKDSSVGRNASANTDISAGASPGAAPPPTPTQTVYYLTQSTGANLWGAVNTNLGTCGTSTPNLVVSTAPLWTTLPAPATPPPARGLLTTARSCGTASTNNFMASNATAWCYTWRNFAGFYSAPYANRTVVAGSATGNTFGFQSSSGTSEYVLVLLAVVDSNGNHVADTTRYVAQYTVAAAMTAYSLDLSSLSVTVPAGSRLAVLFYYYEYCHGSVNHRIAYDNYSAGITNQITLRETILDRFAPTWSGGVSGIAAQDAGTDGVLRISWNSASDSGGGQLASTPPVLYDLYRVQNPACTGLWESLNLYRLNLGSTSYQDSGLTNGLTYCYGVRAKDGANPQQFTSNDAQTATATPTRPAGSGCNGCHASPPTSTGNAGGHAAHANGDADYAECANCHPGTTSYTNSHQDGRGQLAFDGTAATAVYNGNQLTYTDNAQVIYNDANGYGILTGSAGDGSDNGSCARAQTSATQCHGGGSVDPVWGGTLTAGCGACHNSTGKQAAAAPTVTMASSHITAPGGSGTCNDCHAGHFRGVRVPLPPASWSNPNLAVTNMRTQLGIAYTGTGGIELGGPGTVASITARATEAEICWGCHDSVASPVSEWGYNTKTTPAGFPVTIFATADGNQESENYGWLYTTDSYASKTSDWTQGFWMSAYDTLLKRRVASVHTASFDAAGQSSSVSANVGGNGTVQRSAPNLEHKGTIRCSYCHDVHDTFGPAGKPYLRGSWVGDPYPPELPPRNTYTYTTAVGRFSTTPRSLSTSRDKGGYFIDQNSNWPAKNAAMDTLAETSGLCTLCHGTNVDAMDYYAGSKLWLPGMANGHSNSCLGGTRASARDLFTGARGGCGMGLQGCVAGNGCDGGYPFSQSCSSKQCPPSGCGPQIYNSGWYWGSAGGNPVGSFTAGGGDVSNWYGAGTIGGADGTGSMAHTFTCAKCHSPHATGLPALLIQNCIDPGLSTWGVNGVNVAANNCHRKSSTTDGWHVLAPGQ